MQINPTFKDLKSVVSQGTYDFVPVALTIAADVLTPVLAYLRLNCQGRQSFLLESAEGGEQVGRYSFIGVDPFAEISCRDQEVVVKAPTCPIETYNDADPSRRIAAMLSKWRAPFNPDLPPFQGGAIGYISYDAARYFEQIPMPTARLDCWDMRFMFFKCIIAFDRLKHQVFLIHNVDTACASLRAAYDDAIDHLRSLRGIITASEVGEAHAIPQGTSNIVLPKVSESMGADRFQQAVREVKKHIRAGDIFQCVIANSFTLPITVPALDIYRQLRMLNPSPYLFFLDFADETLLGASPEMLVRVAAGKVATCPIAGTRPRGRDGREDLRMEQQMLASKKERAEHLMLVDLGRNDIGRIARIGTVNVERYMQVERYSHVMHLTSLVTGRLRPRLTAWDALQACFPAGTLSGAPKIRAMTIISELEPQRRGPYGGAVVAMDFAGNLNSCITIRSLWLKAGIGRFQAGAGVVADSRPEAEYQEVLNKAKAVRTAIAQAKAQQATEKPS